MLLIKIIIQQLVISMICCYILLAVNEKIHNRILRIFGVGITVLIALMTVLSVTITILRRKDFQTNPVFLGQNNGMMGFKNIQKPSLPNIPDGSMGSFNGQQYPGTKKIPANKP